MTHLLVTNDFPPKLGGIQSYLYELWRRLPPERFGVLTVAQEGADRFDVAQRFAIRRLDVSMLYPRPSVRAEIERFAREIGATHVVLDPALPIGLVGRRLDFPYSLVVHGAELTVQRHLPGLSTLLRRAVTGAELVIAAGRYPASEVRALAGSHCPSILELPPGVDVERFRPLDPLERGRARARLGLSEGELGVVSVSRLVPRKGMDVLIRAVGRLASDVPGVRLLIAGTGRDRARLDRVARATGAPVRFLGRVNDAELPELYAAADVMAMLCRDRWLGLEREGFGIVFLEAAASGTAVVAGTSGGAEDAVADGVTGLVVRDPRRLDGCVAALRSLLADEQRRLAFGAAGRERARASFDYVGLAARLDAALSALERRPTAS